MYIERSFSMLSFFYVFDFHYDTSRPSDGEFSFDRAHIVTPPHLPLGRCMVTLVVCYGNQFSFPDTAGLLTKVPTIFSGALWSLPFYLLNAQHIVCLASS